MGRGRRDNKNHKKNENIIIFWGWRIQESAFAALFELWIEHHLTRTPTSTPVSTCVCVLAEHFCKGQLFTFTYLTICLILLSVSFARKQVAIFSATHTHTLISFPDPCPFPPTFCTCSKTRAAKTPVECFGGLLTTCTCVERSIRYTCYLTYTCLLCT